MAKTIEEKYKRLTDVEHVLIRPGRYIGSVKPHTSETWTFGDDPKMSKPNTTNMVKRVLTWNPGLVKLFDEVISNAVDHSKRPEGKHLDTIKVEIDRAKGEISVYDNGGIPVEFHKDYDEYVPSLIFGYLRSGSNFDDTEDSTGTGQNGEGASLTNIFSTTFTVETCDGKNRFKQTWSENMMKKTKPKVTELSEPSKGFSRITFVPDYAHLETELNDDNYAKLVKRVYDIAGCNPTLRVYLNGERLQIKSFKDYVELYTTEFEYDENKDWQVAIAKSDNGFQHVSFVNTTETVQGGAHIHYVVSQVAAKLRELIKKKYKIDVKPGEISAHFQLFLNATIVRPRYDSQTKENLITEAKEFKTSWEPTDKFIAKLFKSEIIQRILDWVEAKAKAAELAELRALNKETDKASPRKIIKLQDAGLAGKEPENCILFITEGDSASKSGQSTRDPKTMGFLSLRGKPINVNSTDVAGIVANVEFKNFMIAMGLKIGEKVTNISQLRYSKVGIMTDADHDGAGHITGLLISNIHHFWPELFELGVIHRFVTPLVKIWVGSSKKSIDFYEDHEFKAWLAANPTAKYRLKYFKGLATNQSAEFKEYLTNINDHLIMIVIEEPEDTSVINLVFGKSHGSADKRKVWLRLSDEVDAEADALLDVE